MRKLLPFTFLALLVFAVGCDSAEEDTLDGPADITGEVVDSQLGDPIEGATVTFSRGEASRSATTDSSGTFLIEGIATGTLTMQVQADGFLLTEEQVEIVDGINELPQTTAAEAPPAGAYRIVLSWDEEPGDLDSHLTGPDGENGRFHVYFPLSSRTFGDIAVLDRDDQDGEGPETITLNPLNDGMYRYSVFNYSSQGEAGSQGIAGDIENSIPARVQVYDDQRLIGSYRAPAATPGNTWRVFEMNVSNGTATITDVNEYVDASGSGDIEVFRMPGK